jgi:hypothetical protein
MIKSRLICTYLLNWCTIDKVDEVSGAELAIWGEEAICLRQILVIAGERGTESLKKEVAYHLNLRVSFGRFCLVFH